VIDDGFDLSHPDFSGAGKIVAPKDYVDGDARPFPETDAGDYHGTPCAGVAIAESNGRGVVGVAHGCAFMPVRFPLAADDDLLIEIFEEVGRHAHVISCSWGPPPVFAPLSEIVTETFTRLARDGGPNGRGCVILFAAGNYNAPLSDSVNAGGFVWRDGRGVLRRTTGPILNGMACHPEVICVAASTSLNRHSAYSNWGPAVSVCAPSNNFHPLDPQQFVPGRGIWTTDNEAFGEGFTANSRYTGRFGGTSSATPLAAGVGALVLSANPALTAREVRDILQVSADKIEDGEPDIVLGTNRGRYDAGGRCDWFGYGKVDAAAAVQAARAQRTLVAGRAEDGGEETTAPPARPQEVLA
jgi:subtilisin family serine protease